MGVGIASYTNSYNISMTLGRAALHWNMGSHFGVFAGVNAGLLSVRLYGQEDPFFWNFYSYSDISLGARFMFTHQWGIGAQIAPVLTPSTGAALLSVNFIMNL